jgi:leader peptidase (prepilin peptidase)/N-methyltransferase
MDPAIALNLFLLASAPFVGSFLNVVAERWPKGEPFVRGRSRCDQCGHVLGWRDLVPIASWVVARARCRYCGGILSPWHPVVEGAALVIAIWALLQLSGPLAGLTILLGWALLALAIIDLRSLWLPDILTLPLGFAGLVLAWIFAPSSGSDHAIGAVVGYVLLAAARRIYRRYRGREGLGEGDARLFGAAGAWVGWQGLGTVLLYAGFTALAVLLIGARAGRPIGWTTRLPFGAHLCLAIWLVWLYGPLYID